jgi:hypothetical protein
MKLGRNQLCPCGSGLKFKKCCLANPHLSAGPSLKLRPEYMVPAPIVDDVFNGIFSLPDDVLVQRMEALADSQPNLCAFITMMASSLLPSAAFPAALSAFAIIWMFDQHHRPHVLPIIDLAAIQRCFHRSAKSVLDFDSPSDTTWSARNQPHIHKFIADTLFDFDENSFDGFDLLRLLMMLKTTLDTLHEATSKFAVAHSPLHFSATAS